MLKRPTLILALIFMVGISVFAQVTTAKITGTIKSAKGEDLAGATVTATHLPSGTVYSTIAQKGGVFTLQGLRVGGPYTVVITYKGLKPETLNDISLRLEEKRLC